MNLALTSEQTGDLSEIPKLLRVFHPALLVQVSDEAIRYLPYRSYRG